MAVSDFGLDQDDGDDTSSTIFDSGLDQDDSDDTSSTLFDSGLDQDDDDDASSTCSAGPSLFDVEYEHERTYCSRKRPHLLPIDEEEQSRLDLQYQMCLTTLGGLLSCPVTTNKLHRVLDVGTGTGLWAIDFGDMYPNSHVIGIDCRPILPSWVPPNVEFRISLAEDMILNEKFDLIHFLMPTFSIANWGQTFQESFRSLNSGGYIEVLDIEFPIVDSDSSLSPNSLLWDWSCKMLEAARAIGILLDSAKFHQQQLEKAGFRDVKVEKYKWPQNSWPAEKHLQKLGALNLANIINGIEGMTLRLFTKHFGWTRTEVHLYLSGVKKEMKNVNIHAYWNIYVAHGHKA